MSRSVSVLMGMRAGLPALYFDKLSDRKREEYFAAVRAGRPVISMAELFTSVIARTLQIHGK